ncbi:virion core protein, T7 gp14 family [Oleispirillum naphthae]|uniref:virion core protein, T7 gp14 family n=1 Tax=Oleispirillum naphthae TaxID=2838853 RepID=UPI0030822842
MCEPSTTTLLVASLALSAASMAAGVVGQQKQAKAQERYIKDSAVAANGAARENYAQINQNLAQKEAVASQKIQEEQKRRLQAQGTAIATSDASGQSFDMLLDDYSRQEAGYRSTVERQLKWDQEQAEIDKEGYEAQAQNRITSAIGSGVKQPDYLGAGLQVLSSGVDAYGSLSEPKTDASGKTYRVLKD